MKKMNTNPWLKLAAFAGVIAALFFLLRGLTIDFSSVSVDAFKERIDSYGVWGPVAYIFFYLIRPLILFPAGILSASAGVIWGAGQGLMIVLIAAYISAVAEFLIARYFAREAVEKMAKGRMRGIDQAIEKRGFITVLLIRLIPNLPWDAQNLGLGITKVSFRDYFWATVIGIIPGSFAFVYLGASFISVVTNPENFWKIFLAFGVFALIYLLQKKYRGKKDVVEEGKSSEG